MPSGGMSHAAAHHIIRRSLDYFGGFGHWLDGLGAALFKAILGVTWPDQSLLRSKQELVLANEQTNEHQAAAEVI